MFTIDFTKPWLYKDIIYFNQGNLSTNNTLRCKLVTGGSDDFTGGSIACTFTTKDSVEISGLGRLVDAKSGIVDIVFPSNALVVGTNKLEVLVNRTDGGVAQSPPVMYDIWQGLTTGNGIEAETNYPILIELINSTNEASNKANSALNKANSMITDMTDAIDNAYRSANDADIATSNANTKIEEVENAKVGMINKVDTEIANMKTQVNASTNTMTSKFDMKIADVDSAIASGTKDLEVKESRRDMDGVEHDTLKLRLESDLKKGKVIEETKEGTYLSFNDTVGGLVSYLEVLGNTVQDPSNLANIRSSCIPNGDGTFKMSILSCGKNILSSKFEVGGFAWATGLPIVATDRVRSVDFVRVNGGDTVVLSQNLKPNPDYRILEYDKNKNFITVTDWLKPVTLNINTYYVKIATYGNAIFNASYDTSQIKAQLEYGTVVTPYTPYQETRCDIKLPMQLKGVKGGKDILYYDELENAWCILRKIAYLNYSELTNVGIASTLTNCIQIHGTSSKEIKSYDSTGSSLITSKPFKHSFDDDEHMWIDSNTWKYKASIPKTIASTLDEVKAYLAKGDLFMYFWDKSPEKIVLPQSEQIKLNSFANKTHIYTISGDVDVTVKATVSKSLASTVQANTEEISRINNTIADIQGLKESQDFAYETDKDYLVCKDTQNGVVKDLKIYGKSIVNVAPKSIAPIKLSIDKRVNDTALISPIPADTEFTVGVNITAKKAPLKGLLISFHFTDGTFAYDVLSTGVYSQFKTFKFNKDIKAISEYLHLDELTADATANITFDSLMVCEGVINTYFEGIASVGNGNEIEVLSSDNGNLFDGEFIKGTVNGVDGNLIPDTNGYMITQKNIIKVFPGISVKYKSTGARGFRPGKNVSYYYYDKSEKIISRGSLNTFDEISIPNGCYGLRLTFADFELNSSFNASNYNMTLNQIGTLENSNFAKQDKKTILFKDTDNTWKPILNLRGIDENNCDFVDSTNNKYSVKVKEITNLKDLKWSKEGSFENKDTYFYKLEDGFKNVNITQYGVDCVCDKLKSVSVNYITGAMHNIVDCVAYDIRYQVIRISVPKDTNLVEYLTNLNPRFIYPLNEVVEYEINPIYPDSYDDETMILIDGVVVAPKASFKITSSLPNFLSNVEDRVSRLENEIYKINLANFAVALNTLDVKARLEALEAPIN